MFALINDDKSLSSLIRRAIASGARFNLVLHEAAYNCLARVDGNGDVRPLNTLYAGLAPAARNALKAWAVKFGKVRFVPEQNGFKVAKSVTHTDFEAAAATSPMDYQREIKPKTAKVFDLATEIAKLVEKAEKHEAAPKAIEALRNAIKAA